jgi:menaquinone-dependent protoporphyrinogen IX oxidase
MESIFVGSPVRVGSYLRSVVRFVQARREVLERVPSAFFSVKSGRSHPCKGERKKRWPRRDDAREVEKFIRATGLDSPPRRAHRRSLPYSRYNFLVRFVMRRISAQAGRRHRHVARLRVHRLEARWIALASDSSTRPSEHAPSIPSQGQAAT